MASYLLLGLQDKLNKRDKEVTALTSQTEMLRAQVSGKSPPAGQMRGSPGCVGLHAVERGVPGSVSPTLRGEKAAAGPVPLPWTGPRATANGQEVASGTPSWLLCPEPASVPSPTRSSVFLALKPRVLTVPLHTVSPF